MQKKYVEHAKKYTKYASNMQNTQRNAQGTQKYANKYASQAGIMILPVTAPMKIVVLVCTGILVYRPGYIVTSSTLLLG